MQYQYMAEIVIPHPLHLSHIVSPKKGVPNHTELGFLLPLSSILKGSGRTLVIVVRVYYF